VCGIFGIVGRRMERQQMAQAAATMRHRGPDAEGVLVWEDGALAHRRLSILDTSAAANQPFEDCQHRAAIVFNGEIYNYVDLRRQLQALGHSFHTTSDTEVLLASYLQWREACVERLNGMFAFAVWDYRARSLFLVRDRLGKKPLLYARLPDGALLFASELKPLLASNLIDDTLDAEALLDYLHLNYVLTPKTLLRSVRQLPAGSWATWRDGQWQTHTYWDLADSFLGERFGDDEVRILDQLGELLADATRLRLYSDVPLGGFLSGGVDSSTVVAMMRHQGTADVHTFSIEFPAAEFNEGAYSRLAAKHLGTVHHPQVVDEQVADVLPEFAYRIDSPLGDDSAISTYLLSCWARRHVTVALSGDGADELFAGYVTYQADALRRRLGRLRRPVARVLGWLGPRLPERGAKLSRRFRAEQFRRGLGCSEADAHFTWRQVGTPGNGVDWLAPDLVREAGNYDPVEVFRDHHERVRGADWLDRMLYLDCRTWLCDDILVKVDRASMAASLECRAPFLDYRIAEFAARLPHRMKLRGGQKKIGLRRLARRFLPSSIVDRKKAGFNSPTVEWLSGPLRPLVEELFFDGALASLGLCWQPRLATQWREFLEGARHHQYGLWGLLGLALWQRHVRSGCRTSAGRNDNPSGMPNFEPRRQRLSA
jgi:asparagine synthase (glutamine-hydrolysing)